MGNSPILWGPNSISNNLQNSILNANGQQLAFNGNKNYLANPTIELGTTSGWSLGTVTLTSKLPTGTPTFGSGASGNLTLSATSTTPLSGIYSLSYASSAATTAGNFVASDAFVVDTADLGKVLNFSFYYQATSNPSNANWSGTNSNSFAVAIYDVTAGAANWIIPVGVFNLIQSAGVGICTGSFQSSVVSGQQYRIVCYNANATAGAITVYFDQAFLGPSASSSTSSVVSWNGSNASQAVTANVTNLAFTTIKDSNAAWNGSQYVVPVAGDYFFAISAIYSTAATLQVYLNGSIYNSNGFANSAAAPGTINGSILVSNCKPGDLISIRSTANATYTNANASVFQVGGAQVGPAGQAVTFSGSNASQAITANSTNIALTAAFDTNGAWNGTQYVVPTSGSYFVGGGWSASAPVTLQPYVNGSIYLSFAKFSSASSTADGSGFALLANLKAGDLISFRGAQSVTLTSATFGIALIQGPSSQQASPTVAASYFLSANFASSTTIPVNFDTKIYDYTNSVSTSATAWKFTAPTTGLYTIGGYLQNNAGANVGVIVYKNGSSYQGVSVVNTSFGQASINMDIQLNAGDFIDIRSTISNTWQGGAQNGQATGYVTIKKVG